MKAQECPQKVCCLIRLLAVALVIAGMLVNSADVIAQNDRISFNTMMQSAGTQPAEPSSPGSRDASSQTAQKSSVTGGGKAEIAGGIVLLGAGVLTIIATAALSSSGFKPSGGKTGALYGGGAATAGVGVTLIVLGTHHRSKK